MQRLTHRKRVSLPLLAALIATLLATVGTAAQSSNLAAPPASGPAGPAQGVAGHPNEALSPEGLLNPDGTLDLSTGFQGTLDLRGWDVTLDGERGPVLRPASVSAATPATAWDALPNEGLNGAVLSLAMVGSDLYVGGMFNQTGDGSLTNLGNIARYDTTAGTWHALPHQGLNGLVFSLAMVGNDLYVGGRFTQTGDLSLMELGHIARYDTVAGSWNALSQKGLNDWVYALAVVGSDLYMGGLFTDTVGVSPRINLGHIARYDTVAGTWNELPNEGLNGVVRALAVAGSDLYVGGVFDQTGDGSLTNLGHIARYDTTAGTWNELPNEGLNSSVRALEVAGSDLYVGGYFYETGDGTTLTDLGYIARYDTVAGSWHGLPHEGLNDRVYALAVIGGDLYVGGQFGQTGDGSLTDLGRIARYDTVAGTWNKSPNDGLNGIVWALAAAGSDLYVGGQFDQTGDGSLTNLGSIARYDTTAIPWHALPNQGLNNYVEALAVVGSDLYVGGLLYQTGDGTLTDLGHIARYDTVGSTWHALSHQGLNDMVWALAVVGSDLYVGGFFRGTGAGTVANLNYIARYDTTAGSWHALPNGGLDSCVRALAVLGSDLYVGGEFDGTDDGTLADLGHIARYDTTAGSWHALPHQGLDDWVLALAVAGSDLYVGGGFDQTGDGSLTNLGHIARYDTTASTWHALPHQGLDDWVLALAVVGSDLYVGGWFNGTGDGTTLTDLGHIARYDTAADSWHALPQQGLNDDVWALAAVGSELYVGGQFTDTVGVSRISLGHIARYDTAAGAWRALPNEGLNHYVWALAVAGDDLYVGGDFDQTGDGTVTGLGGIARYDLYPNTVYLPLVMRE